MTSANDFALELLHQELTYDAAQGLRRWRKLLLEALEALDLRRTQILIAELSRHEAGDIGRGFVRMGKGAVLSRREQTDAAIKELNTAASLFESAGEMDGLLLTLMTLGNLHADQAKWNEALQAYEHAQSIFRDRQDSYGEAQLLVNIAALHFARSDWGRAAGAYQRSLDVFLEVGDGESAAMSLSGLGHVLTELGNYEEAIECYEVSLEIFVESGNIRGQAAALSNLGKTYDSMGESRKAIESLELSLSLAQQADDLRSQAIALDNLGLALHADGRDEDALVAHEQSLAIYRQLDDPLSASAALNHLGIAHAALQEFDQADACYQEAMELKYSLGDHRGMASVLINHALMKVKQGDWLAAAELAAKAAPHAEQSRLSDQEATLSVLHGLIAIVLEHDLERGAAFYASALQQGFEHHTTEGERISRFIVRYLEALAEDGRADEAALIARRIMELAKTSEFVEHPTALGDLRAWTQK